MQLAHQLAEFGYRSVSYGHCLWQFLCERHNWYWILAALPILWLSLYSTIELLRTNKQQRLLHQIGFKAERNQDFWRLLNAGKVLQQQTLMSDYELKLFRRLQQQFGQHYDVFCQVALGALVKTTFVSGSWHGSRLYSILNRYRVDFVLYSKRAKRVIAVIELDDHTHLRGDRIERDRQVDAVLEQAGIPIIHLTSLRQQLVLRRGRIEIA